VANICLGRYKKGKADKLLVMPLLAVLLDIYFVSTLHSGHIDKEKSPFRQVHATVPTKKKSYWRPSFKQA
jgi:hypothetical protein